MLYMLSIYAQCYDAILYCMGTIDTGIVDMGTIDMGTIIWGPSYGDHLMGTIDIVVINMRSWDSMSRCRWG